MVSSGVIAAVLIANQRRAADDRRRRREEDDRRRRREEEDRRRRKKEEEERRRRREEEERRRRRENQKRHRHNEDEERRRNKQTENLNQEQEYQFSTEHRLSKDELKKIYSGTYDSILLDGSHMSGMKGRYVRIHSDGRVKEYISDGNYYSDLILTREELPNGAMVVYERDEKVYELDKDGNYVYYKRDQYTGEVVEKIEGNVYAGENEEFSTEYEITRKDLGIVFYGAYDDILLDGSRLSYNDGKYVRTHPNGRVQEYRCNGYGNDYLILTREELPNGAMVVYDNGKKEYERDKDGNYVCYKRDQYTGEIVEKIEGKVDLSEAENFSTEYEITRKDLGIVFYGAYENILLDGSRLSDNGGKYVRTHPNGRVQEYRSNGYGSDCLILTREELPNGAMVVYSGYGKKEYERDKDGNYVYYKRDQYTGDIVEKKEGKFELKETEAEEFSTELKIKVDDLGAVHKGAYRDILQDGSYLSSIEGGYVRTYPNGRVQEYKSGYNGNLILVREELPNGAMVVYRENGKKEYERDKDGNYVYYKRDQYTGDVVEKEEGRFNGDEHIWTKSFYNKDGNVKFYQKSDELNKKYYSSGRLYEEIKEDKSCFQYAENGICLYEKNANDEYCRYQLTPDGKDRLLIEKGKGSWCLESYSYYPSGQLKEKSTYYGGCFQYTENGICLYEKHENGQYSKYQLTPDGEDRLLIEIGSNGLFTEKFSYYPSGRLKEAKHMDGSCVKYNENQTYSKFDKEGRLTEMTDATGKTCFSHYPNSKQVKHIVKYDTQGKKIDAEYKHFTLDGVDNTEYYLAIKQILANKIKKSREDAERKGISPEERKISKRMSKAEKIYTKIKAKINSR